MFNIELMFFLQAKRIYTRGNLLLAPNLSSGIFQGGKLSEPTDLNQVLMLPINHAGRPVVFVLVVNVFFQELDGIPEQSMRAD